MEGPECNVCMSVFCAKLEPYILNCGHSFCKPCVKKIREIGRTIDRKCPVCKMVTTQCVKNYLACEIMGTIGHYVVANIKEAADELNEKIKELTSVGDIREKIISKIREEEVPRLRKELVLEAKTEEYVAAQNIMRYRAEAQTVRESISTLINRRNELEREVKDAEKRVKEKRNPTKTNDYFSQPMSKYFSKKFQTP